MLSYVVLDYEKGMCLNSPYTFGEIKKKKLYIYMRFQALVAGAEFTSNINRLLCSAKL